METQEVGRVMTEALIENIGDVWESNKGVIPDEQVRRSSVTNALVDTGATLLSLPTRFIEHLGIIKSGKRNVTSSKGETTADMYSAVRPTIKGHACTIDVLEVTDDFPVLIGQLPLEHLDFVVDPKKGRN